MQGVVKPASDNCIFPAWDGPRPNNSDAPLAVATMAAAPVATAKELATETKKEQAEGYVKVANWRPIIC